MNMVEADLRVADVCIIGLLCKCLIKWKGSVKRRVCPSYLHYTNHLFLT